MTILAALAALFVLWWYAKNAKPQLVRRLRRLITPRVVRRSGGYVLLALAAVAAIRGRVELAILFGGIAFWFLDGVDALVVRLRGLVGRVAVARPTIVLFEVMPDGRTADGIVQIGPYAGRRLSQLPDAALMQIFAVCRKVDRIAARRLQTYLDGRTAAGRVDAERDANARSRRSPDPGSMTQEEAHQILGLQSGATLQQIRTAHRTLMKRWHPDQGGTVEGASRINAARDRLVSRHR
ncbi:DnaJ domain-containing protein [Methylobacterium sp. WCS2018Hpa-22]|uniref:J domain-containing protein n=1 Tax=Methylobacterium sp. WCS2018Hpa-22 TaxID=3073633 RepID=UPI00288C4DE5|nr:DnaJ domain-containing protein [Methylobacterium sp. WCS2018Hpa-22]